MFLFDNITIKKIKTKGFLDYPSAGCLQLIYQTKILNCSKVVADIFEILKMINKVHNKANVQQKELVNVKLLVFGFSLKHFH